MGQFLNDNCVFSILPESFYAVVSLLAVQKTNRQPVNVLIRTELKETRGEMR